MATTKLYDLVVKTGEYQSNGQAKARYENIGSVMRNENGQFALIKKTFNPAGVPGDPSRDSVMVSMFEPRVQGGNQQGGSSGGYDQSPQGGYGGGGQSQYAGNNNDLDDGSEIPF